MLIDCEQNAGSLYLSAMAATALLIGGTGFVGRHLACRLRSDYDVIVTGRDHDIRDEVVLGSLTATHRPALVVNLAAITTVRETVEHPRAAYDIAFTGLFNLFEALDETGFDGRFLQISSSEVYGHPKAEDLPLNETSPLQPMSPYSVAKIAADMLSFEWAQHAPFDIMVARPFTHIGPDQSERFAVARFAAQIARIMTTGAEPKMSVGNLRATRDLTDVRDLVRAYDLILRRGENGAVYNVCSGIEVTMSSVLDEMVRLSGRDIEIVEEAALTRGTEQQRLRGSYDALHRKTNWKPEIPLSQTLNDIIETSCRNLAAWCANPGQ